MPRILLNLLYLDPGRTGGMEVVARGLIPELAAAMPAGFELHALINARADVAEGPWHALPCHVLDVDVSARGSWVRSEVLDVPRVAGRARADLIHSLGNTGPLWSEARRSVTVHDLIHHRVPQRSVASQSARRIVATTARRAHRLIVPAEQTRDDLIELLGIPFERIDVVHNGVVPPSGAATPEAELRAAHGLGDRPFLLSPSARQPHKNLPRLLEAHALLPGPRPLLVLPGYATGHDAALQAQIARLGIAGDVRLLGWVTDADLEGLYVAAQMLVFPSLYEGFGLPVVEAMLRGLPVACSDRGSLAEIAGSAALTFDPLDPAAIARAIGQLLGDAFLREQLVVAGREQAARYVWPRAAAGYVASFRRALAG